ncbi:hypothetical protein MAR_028787 [Mya arenaria]|uniref:Uncharacterized protein n=1 Tax=Mya arenaria TaxID=6604 RepID=A0ABY7DEL8_MYAAR|nr:hypothetical protein MAR_028787 [Mya arenaria]
MGKYIVTGALFLYVLMMIIPLARLGTVAASTTAATAAAAATTTTNSASTTTQESGSAGQGITFGSSVIVTSLICVSLFL